VTPDAVATAFAAALRVLLAGSHLMSPDELPDLATTAASELGAAEVVLYLVDYEQRRLTPLPSSQTGPRTELSVDGSLAGRAFWSLQAQESEAGDSRRLWLPMLVAIERVGVLEVVVPTEGKPLGVALRQALVDLGHLITELLIVNRTYTDVYEWARRRAPMTLAAEMQHAALPSLTFGTHRVVVSGLLAPAYEVGGDVFDYALNGNIAHVAVFDAIGHGLHACLLANVAVSSYRHARRAGLDLAQMAVAVDAAIAELFGSERFATGVIGQLDVDTGVFRWINAGHPEPMLLRDGHVVKELLCEPSLPLGLNGMLGPPAPEQFVVSSESLQPGDRLLVITDGVDEARTEDGEFFGRARVAEFAARQSASGLPTPEVMRRLHHAFLDHQIGHLQDDATTLFVEWLTGTVGAPGAAAATPHAVTGEPWLGTRPP